MTIEFYGDVSEYTKRRADKLKKRYFAKWLAALTALTAVAAIVAAFANGGYIAFVVVSCVLGILAAWLYFSPMKKSMAKEKWTFRVVIDGDFLYWTQYLPNGKTVEKKRLVSQIKRVVKTNYCYYLVYNDISNAFICERNLLKRGTFDALEQLFTGKIRVSHNETER